MKEIIRQEQGRDKWIFEGVKRFGPGRQASLSEFLTSIDRYNHLLRNKKDRAMLDDIRQRMISS
ncbi:MAG: hypothetical protein E7Z70_02120 [Thermoplasmata archaeon]|nr:hypothetical protein [Thermoplasmata archaeon]